MDLLEYQGKQLFARHGVPVPDGQPARPSRTRSPPPTRSATRASIKAQVQIGGRGKLGGIKIAQRPRRGRAARRARSSAWTSAASPSHELWIEDASRDRLGVLRLGRVRPLGQGAAGDALDQGRHGHRAGGRRGPGRDRHPPRRPAARLPGLPRPPAGLRGRRRRRRRAAGRRDAREAVRRVRRPRRRRWSRSTR